MDRKEKFELAARKDIPFLAKASILYGDSTSTRSLVLAIPFVGSSIDLVLSKNGQEYVIRRIQTFLEEIQVQLKDIEENTFKINDEEALFDLFQTAYENVTKSRSKDKIKRFARLVSNCLISEIDWDEAEAAIRLISDLTDTHINIIKFAVSIPASTNEAFKGLRIISISKKENEFNVPSLRGELSHLSDAAIKMYCSELISKGLLHDEGIGRWGTGSLELLIPTELADWLLIKIEEINNA